MSRRTRQTGRRRRNRQWPAARKSGQAQSTEPERCRRRAAAGPRDAGWRAKNAIAVRSRVSKLFSGNTRCEAHLLQGNSQELEQTISSRQRVIERLLLTPHFEKQAVSLASGSVLHFFRGSRGEKSED